ncbi:uncharacterized protein LOC114288846 [Camellia sinensis]|uniref:uncharacterized protein LOC114288846 n=1 Tax=Camellia sinensis TaxID=4442 RepID=UPI00103661F0|nr:uncharacterized protein LOC114288846 [Camellia sinensis]
MGKYFSKKLCCNWSHVETELAGKKFNQGLALSFSENRNSCNIKAPLGEQCASQSYGVKVLGSIETSVVGLSHLFRTSADTNGSQLKKLASFLGKCYENANGMLEIVLRRNTNIPADANAVSILIPNPEEFSKGDCVQLGFLPRNVAKWVAPLSDSGLFRFSGYVYPKEVLVTALEGSTGLVQMILYVSQLLVI